MFGVSGCVTNCGISYLCVSGMTVQAWLCGPTLPLFLLHVHVTYMLSHQFLLSCCQGNAHSNNQGDRSPPANGGFKNRIVGEGRTLTEMLLRLFLCFSASVIHQTTVKIWCNKLCFPHRNQMEPGEEAEERPQFHQQNAAL